MDVSTVYCAFCLAIAAFSAKKVGMLSQRTRYSIRALQHLARHYGEGPIQLAEIATAQNIPAKFLTVILSSSRAPGSSPRCAGATAGYWLALAPVDVRYGDILRLTDGSLALVPCASRFAHEPCKNCLPEESCELRRIMLKVRDETAAILDRLTLADRFEMAQEDG